MKYNYTQPANELQRFANMVEFPDAEPTENSAQLVTSGGVYDAIQAVEEEAKQLSYNSLMEDTASGSIASFPDGAENVPVKELTADIEPIQDLHGQASPWPENGNKNLIPMTLAGLKARNTAGTWSGDTYTINGRTFAVQTDNGGNVTGILVNGSNASASNFRLSSVQLGGVSVDLFSWLSQTDTYRLTSGLTGDGANTYGVYYRGNSDFVCDIVIRANYSASNLLFKPMLRLATESEDFAPYSNICPISGYTGAEITRTSANLWDEEWEQGRYDIQTGNKSAYSGAIRSKNYILCKPSTTYYFNTNNTGSYVLYYDQAKNYLSYGGTSGDGEFTTPENCSFMTFYLYGSYGGTYHNDISINYPSTDTSYHAYNGTTYSVSWTDEGTVYKGKLVINADGSGELYAEDGVAVYDGSSDEAWTVNTSRAKAYIELSTMKKLQNYSADILCNEFAPVENDTRNVLSIAGYYDQSGNYPTQNWLYINRIDEIGVTSTAELKTWLSSHNLQVVYPLATPQTYHLDSIGQITTLLGDNNIWSDTGDISVKYRCNTALYIEKKLG